MPYTALRPIVNHDNEFSMIRPHAATCEHPHALPARQSHEREFSDRFSFDTVTDDCHWHLDDLSVLFEPAVGILWQRMKPRTRPSFTHGLLRDLNAVADSVQAAFERQPVVSSNSLQFIVTGSQLPGIFNLGGDLSLFLSLIESRDRDALRRYAHACARGQHRLHSAFDVPVCMIALVQGDALGGGFEAALAHDVIIAERQAQFGLPEVLFNLFPGMGAYSFLSRKIGAAEAERMILTGKVYTAEELHTMGIVDYLVEEGGGPAAVYDFTSEYARSLSRQAVMKTRKLVGGVSIAELITVADVWVDTAMRLSPSDLRRMAHLAKAQDRRWSRLVRAG
jgi:DSF synthase